MKIVFMGTPEFAVASLRTLYECGQDVALAVTQPDRPKGRGYKLTPSPVKEYALAHGTEVIAPETLKDEAVIEKLQSIGADMFIVTAYGKILSQRVLSIPRIGCFNIHASLLPHLRGAAPINRAVMNGDTVGGVTVMYMDAGMDTGDMIIKKYVDIPEAWNAGDYYAALMEAGSEALAKFLRLAESGNIPREKQCAEEATYAPKIEQGDLLLDFSAPGREVFNKIRGLSPAPCAYFLLGGKRIKIRRAEYSPDSGEAGTLLSADKNGIKIACGSGSVVIRELCPEGKGVVTAESYLNGHRLEAGVKVDAC